MALNRRERLDNECLGSVQRRRPDRTLGIRCHLKSHEFSKQFMRAMLQMAGGTDKMRLRFKWGVTVALATALSIAAAANAQDSQYSARQVQQALVDGGYDLGAVDGLWGRRSITALRAFQKARDLAQTGILDGARSWCIDRGADGFQPLMPLAMPWLPCTGQTSGVRMQTYD